MTGKRFKHFFHIPRNRLVFRPEAGVDADMFRGSERMMQYSIDDLIPTNFGTVPEEDVVSQMAHDVTTHAKQQVFRAMAKEKSEAAIAEQKQQKDSSRSDLEVSFPQRVTNHHITRYTTC